MKPKWMLVAAAAVAVITIAAFLVTREPPSDPVLVNQSLGKVAQAVDREWTNRIVGMLHEDYSDDMGNSRASLRANLAQAFWGPRNFEVVWDHVAITDSTEETITADVNFEVQQYNHDTLVSTHRGIFTVTFLRDGGDVKVLRVEGLEEIAEFVEASYG